MEHLIQYLSKGDWYNRWKSRERSEVLESVYLRLGLCASEGCDTLIAMPGGFIFIKHGRPVNPIPRPLIDPTLLLVNYRDLLRIVRHRELVIREFFQLVREDADGAVYRLNWPGSPPL